MKHQLTLPTSRFFIAALTGLALFGTFALPLVAAEAAKPTVPIPAATNILANLKQAHPRLLATTNDFAQLQSRIGSDSQLHSWHAKLQIQAQGLLSSPPSRYEIPDGLRLLATSRRVLQRVYTLALLSHLDGDQQYAQRAWQELAAAAKFPDWNPRHFLDTAEMTHAFAIGYDWLYDAWTPEQRATLQQAMVEKGLQPALKLYRAHSYWTTAHHNWNQVCNGGIGMGALALADVEPQLAGEILHDASESIQLAMAEFAPDGAWKEGPGYWDYATSYNVVFLAGLQSALGTDFGLSQIGAFRDTGLFPLYVTGPLGRTFNYADGGDHAIFAPQMFWLARQFNQPVLAWYERRATSPSVLDLLWFDHTGTSPKAAGLPLDKYFRGAEVAALRSDWDNPKALFVGFKAGDNKANHSHLDLGSFVFDAAGVRWAMDLGADDYNLPGYFSSLPGYSGGPRWNYYRLRAEGHNTLVINPSGTPDQEPAARAQMIRFESGARRAFAIADLTPAYAKNARHVWRGIALLDREKVLVQDEIQADTHFCALPQAAVGLQRLSDQVTLRPMPKPATWSVYSRREFSRMSMITLAGAASLPFLGPLRAAEAAGKPNSKFAGVQIGMNVPYSFGKPEMTGEEILKNCVQLGLSALELRSQSVEIFMGAPVDLIFVPKTAPKAEAAGREERLRQWRGSATMERAKAFRKIYEDAGVLIEIVKVDGIFKMSPEELDYVFTLAKTLGGRAISTEISHAEEDLKRLGQFADKHQFMVGYHGHANTGPEHWEKAFSLAKYNGANVDIGHFVAGQNTSPIPFIKKYHERVTHVHIKDRKFNNGPNTPFGQGDTPIVETLRLIRDNQWNIQATIEFEYKVPTGSDRNTELMRTIKFCKDALV